MGISTLSQDIGDLAVEGLSNIGRISKRKFPQYRSFSMGFKVSLFHSSAVFFQTDRQQVRVHFGRSVKVLAPARSGGCARALDSKATVNAKAPRQSQDLPAADHYRCADSILWANPQCCAEV